MKLELNDFYQKILVNIMKFYKTIIFYNKKEDLIINLIIYIRRYYMRIQNMMITQKEYQIDY